jgi:mono/diheme cytochrome c family protein
MFKKGNFILAAVLALALGCGEDEAEEAEDNNSNGLSLSSSFASNCASCHGTSGTGTSSGPDLTASSIDTVASWESIVREGQGSMAPVGSSSYSDANLEADFEYFSSQ